MPIRVLFSGYYGFGNVGDEAVLAGTLEGLNRRRTEDPLPMEIGVLSARPAMTRSLHSVQAFQRNPGRDLLKALAWCHLFVSGGGSLLQDATSFRSLLYYLGLILLARLLRRKTLIYAQGIGPLHRSASRKLVRRVLQGVTAISVRDADSADLLRQLGVGREILVGADPALLLPPGRRFPSHPSLANEATQEEISLSSGQPSEKPNSTPIPPSRLARGRRRKIACLLRPWKEEDPVQWAIFCERLAEELGRDVYLIPLYPDQDVPLGNSILQYCQQMVFLSEELPDPRQWPVYLTHFDLVVSVRLHGLIFALLAQVPGVGLCYDPKVRSFMRSAERGGWAMNYPPSVERAIEVCKQALGEGFFCSPEVSQKLQSSADRCVEHLVEVALLQGHL